jgi:hypothetical protein
MNARIFRAQQLLGSLTLLLLGSVVVNGCTCNIPPPACSEYWETEDLFVGTVTKVYRPENAYQDSVEVNVDETFKGMNFRTANTYNYGHSCAHGFSEGTTYLFYASHNKETPNEFGTSLCDRTSKKGEARYTADLEFLRSVKEGKSLYWIWGTVSEIGYDEPYANIRVTLLNNGKKIEATSSEFGDVKLVVDGPGKYRVRVHLPPGTEGVNWLSSNDHNRWQTQRKQIVGGSDTGKDPYVDYEVTVAANRCGWFDVSIPRPEKN